MLDRKPDEIYNDIDRHSLLYVYKFDTREEAHTFKNELRGIRRWAFMDVTDPARCTVIERID